MYILVSVNLNHKMLLCYLKNRRVMKMALDYSVIGQRIKQARLAKNLTQEDLAEQIDMSDAF